MNKFNTWRTLMSLDQSIKIEFSTTSQICKDVVVSSFFYVFVKVVMIKYPSGSIMCMYVTFNWLLKVAKEKWMAFSSVYKPKFCMNTHPLRLHPPPMGFTYHKSMRQNLS